MATRDDDEADQADQVWRAIVENYGDRAEVTEVAAAIDEDERDVLDDLDDLDDLDEDRPQDRLGQPIEIRDEPEDPADRFVPPVPPPLPTPSRDRLFAWLGLFGSPAILLVCLLAGIDLPQLIAYGLVAAFVGGFGYLVFLMPRGPRDPGDDGAVL